MTAQSNEDINMLWITQQSPLLLISFGNLGLESHDNSQGSIDDVQIPRITGADCGVWQEQSEPVYAAPADKRRTAALALH